MISKAVICDLLIEMESCWSLFRVTQEKIDTWHNHLRDCDEEVVTHNVRHYILTSQFPPTISQVRGYQRKDRAVPDTERTYQYLSDMEKTKSNSSEQVMRDSLDSIKNMLEKKRG